jgi:hypothetical protein
MDAPDSGAGEVRRILDESTERAQVRQAQLAAMLGDVERGSDTEKFRTLEILSFAIEWTYMPRVSDDEQVQSLKRRVANHALALGDLCMERLRVLKEAKSEEELERLLDCHLRLAMHPADLMLLARAAMVGLMHASKCPEQLMSQAIDIGVAHGDLPENARQWKGKPHR